MNGLCAQDDGLQPGRAHFVDGRADRAGWEGGVDGALAGGVLAETGRGQPIPLNGRIGNGGGGAQREGSLAAIEHCMGDLDRSGSS